MVELAGRRWSPRPRRPPLFSYTYLLLPLHRSVSVSGGVYCPMGWQQYSRPLWLSRGNPYILYLKAMTVQMRVWRTGFPQGRFSQRELHCSVRVVHWLMNIFAWPESPFWLYTGLPSWAIIGRPFGAGAWWCLCSSTQSGRLTRRSRFGRLEMMSLDLLLRTCASNRFGLALLGPRTRRPGLHVLRPVPAELRSA